MSLRRWLIFVLATAAIGFLVFRVLEGPGRLGFLVGLVALLYGLPFLFAPILARSVFRQTIHRRLEWVDPDDPAIPDAIRSADRAAVGAMETLGFVPVGLHRLPVRSSTVEGYGGLFRSRTGPEIARVGLILAGREPRRKLVEAWSYFTIHADGTEIITSNAQNLSLFPTLGPPVFLVEVFPQLGHPGRLLAAHTARGRELALVTPTVPAFDADPMPFIERTAQRSFDRMVETGYYEWLDEVTLRPTWKGAIVMGWLVLPPVPRVRRWLRLRHARRRLRELGLDPD